MDLPFFLLSMQPRGANTGGSQERTASLMDKLRRGLKIKNFFLKCKIYFDNLKSIYL